jgi:acyl-coenzyme A synthetase/AMP-(fatty) acid ligase
MSILDPILFQCRINPDCGAICVPGANQPIITYGQLERLSNNVGRMAVTLGFGPGQIIGIMVKDKIFHVALILGLTRIGVVTFTCRGPSPPKELGVSAVITDSPQPFTNVDRIIRADGTWLMGDGRPIDERNLHQPNDDDVFRINLTSGTTGIPRGVGFTHRMMRERNARFSYIFGDRFPRSSRLYCDLGLASSPGLRYLIYMLSRGGTIMLFGEDGGSTIQAFDLYKIQNMVTSPHGLGEYLKFYETNSSVPCVFDHIVTFGGLLSPEMAAAARAHMTPHIYSAYGATEVGPVAFGPAHVIAEIRGAVGYVLPDVSVQIVDDTDRPLPLGQEGAVRVRSRTRAQGYVGDPRQSERTFRDGWFFPGDFGCLTADRLLVITGREETRLNVGGDKVNPELVEAVLTAFDGIEDAGVFSVANELGIEEIYALIVASAAIDDQALRAHCQDRLQSGFAPVRFFPVDRIPRNAMGKIERTLLADLARRRPSQ